MPKTIFENGTIVTPQYLNDINNHVHNVEPSQATLLSDRRHEKIDLANHTTGMLPAEKIAGVLEQDKVEPQVIPVMINDNVLRCAFIQRFGTTHNTNNRCPALVTLVFQPQAPWTIENKLPLREDAVIGTDEYLESIYTVMETRLLRYPPYYAVSFNNIGVTFGANDNRRLALGSVRISATNQGLSDAGLRIVFRTQEPQRWADGITNRSNPIYGPPPIIQYISNVQLLGDFN